MKAAENPPDPARFRHPAERSSFQRFSFQNFSFTQIPLFPRNPLFPASGPTTRSSNGLHPKSNFLAISPSCRLAFFAIAVMCLAGMRLSAAPLQAVGIAVVFEGRGIQSNAPAYEYSSLRLGGGSFSLTLLDGKKVANLAGHLVARYDYRTPPSHNALATIEALSRKYVKTEPYLAPRILVMKEELRKAEFEADIVGGSAKKPPAILVADMKVKGKTYKNVRASSMRDGKLQFIHDEGAFSLPALPLPQSFLTKVAQSSPDIAGTHDFQDLMVTYVPSVSISGKSVKGARILNREGGKLIVDTDDGLHTIEESALTPSDLLKLESAGKRLTNLSRKFKAAQERQVKTQDEYFAQIEQEKLARYRIEQKALADAEEIIEGERKIREELAKQNAARVKAESDAQSALWAGLGWMLLGALSNGVEASSSPTVDAAWEERAFQQRQELHGLR